MPEASKTTTKLKDRSKDLVEPNFSFETNTKRTGTIAKITVSVPNGPPVGVQRSFCKNCRGIRELTRPEVQTIEATLKVRMETNRDRKISWV